jgi:hypothetical protein
VGEQDEGLKLDLDKAAYTGGNGPGQASPGQGSTAQPCANCSGSLGAQYWNWQGNAVCEKCKALLERTVLASQSKKAFGRAALLGGAAAFGLGIAYAIFVAVSGMQLALLTIGIAFVIATILRRCSNGVGGRRYQLLAVALTYLASAMGYAPAVVSGLSQRDQSAETAQADDSQQTAERETHSSASAGALLMGVAVILAVTLAAPFLAAMDAPIGLLIVIFGLWEAWRLTKGVPASLDGPYQTAVATGPPQT